MSHRKTTKKARAPRARAAGAPAPEKPLVLAPAAARKDYRALATRLLRPYAGVKRVPMPLDLKPMLATLSTEAFSHPDWQFEIKWDGYRAIAYLDGSKVSLRSRNNLSFNDAYAPIVSALRTWKLPAVVDGEIVVLDEEGRADFGALQQWKRTGKGHLYYYVFDLLWVDGVDLRDKPLTERRALLKQLLPEGSLLRYSEAIEEYGKDFFEMVRKSGLEGMIAKDGNAPYRDGQRSDRWLKVKAVERREAIICGYTKKEDTDRLFSSLVLGVPDGDGLRYIGQVGTGFDRAEQESLMGKMVPLQTRQCPFAEVPKVNNPVDWLRPFLVCEVTFTEETRDGLLRHPSYKGLRPDKTILDFNPETPHNALLIAPGEEATTLKRNGHPLKLTNLQKPFWPQERIRKGDLLNYYAAVSPFLMRYMKDRPQSLHRHPNGIAGNSFYQKNMAGRLEKWLHTFRRVSASSLLPKYFLVCHDEAHLLYMINLGCIELNPWHSTVQQPQHPSWCVIDLDPGDNIGFGKVIEAAQVVHGILDALGLDSYPKTSGATGLHIYIPLGQRYSYEQSRQLAELIARLAHAQLPDTTSLERDPQKRTDRIYLDFLQNRPIQTICAPYSVRPRPGAPVSTPLHWSEVMPGLKPEAFTIKNTAARLRAEGDLFAGVLGRGIDLNHALHQLEKWTK
ncbi:DNA ligase D [Flaviaesturariibacter aridisoli]|uniref:DNA ligase (ATP) n=1 Tax=Flaviaesturariibacter aridisoli TaxID=2545761 RepID=A0A4R4E2A1_9BACT|nr:DNA ligase D [Flaviaesturariibacter aridisoli]TCZ70513.1 DNA ligase D [Flaviaesturariibacter aridisoli]